MQIRTHARSRALKNHIRIRNINDLAFVGVLKQKSEQSYSTCSPFASIYDNVAHRRGLGSGWLRPTLWIIREIQTEDSERDPTVNEEIRSFPYETIYFGIRL